MTRIVWIGLLMLVAGRISGQDSVGGYQFGAGASYSVFTLITGTQSPSDEANYSGGTKGFDVYLFFRNREPKRMNVTTELKYAWKQYGLAGYSGGHGGGTHYDYTCTVGYLDLTFYPSFAMGSSPRFYVAPGLCIGTLLHSYAYGHEESWSILGGYDSTDISGSVRHLYSQMNFRIALRFELEIPVSDKLQIQVVNRYEFTVSKPHFFTGSLGFGIGRIISKNKYE